MKSLRMNKKSKHPTYDKDGEVLVRARRYGDGHRLNGDGVAEVHLPPPLVRRPGSEAATVRVVVHRQPGVVVPQGRGLQRGLSQGQILSWKNQTDAQKLEGRMPSLLCTHCNGAWARSRSHFRCRSSWCRRTARTPRDRGRTPPRRGGTACWSRPGCRCSGRRGSRIRRLQ